MHLDSLDDVEHSKPVPTGCARVLTSSECLEALVEKKRKKEMELELKETRKEEHEQKKKGKGRAYEAEKRRAGTSAKEKT